MIILLTGGSACGKSTFAESLAVSLPSPRYYVATMRPYDDECLSKIARHRRLRKDKGFDTIERYTGMGDIVFPERGTALLECMCNLTANEMFDAEGNSRDAYQRILDDVLTLTSRCDNIIIVTNDVGSDCRAFDDDTERYIDVLGKLNTRLASEADCVCELVCGIPLVLKGVLP